MRSAFYHYKNLLGAGPPAKDAETILDQAKAGRILHEIVFNVLSLQGDEDGQAEEELNELFEENKIKIQSK